MRLRTAVVCSILLLNGISLLRSQEITTYRIINITNNTSAPTQLAIDRGRLVWRETDLNSGNYLFKYYTGAEIIQLDSNLLAVSAAIDGDQVVWNTATELVKAFDTRSWETLPIGASYNPDLLQPVSLSGDLVTFAVRKPGIGTNILVHRLSSGTDTTLSAGTWNTAPNIHHGQVAWVVSDSESADASSNIFFFDGQTTRNVSSTSALNNRKPRVKDAQVLWVESAGTLWRIRLFTGDSVITLAQRGGAAEIYAGYDISDGVGIAGIRDTVSERGRIEIFNSETATRLSLSDSNGVWSPHIDNGLIVWQSGTGPGRTMKAYTIQTGVTQNIGSGEGPVVDDSRIAWTNGDAVETYVPVTFQQLTTDGMNGWEQTKFKTIDSARVVWGNFVNSVNMRLFASDGAVTTELADSATSNDLVMANDSYVIWRRNFDSLYYFDGTPPPVKFLDTVQAENPYVARGSIGFFGSRLTVNETIKHAWLYEIGNGRLTMLSSDSGVTGNVLCEGRTACWLNGQTQRLMFYDGSVVTQLSDSLTDYHYSYRNGVIVWIEHRNGYSQVFLYDTTIKSRTQLTTASSLKEYPITDGSHVVWYETFPVAPAPLSHRGTGPAVSLLGSGPIMTYYDVASSVFHRVANLGYSPLFWNWMSEGKIAWAANGNVYVFDGSAISQLTSDDFNINSGVYLDRGMIEWRRTPNPPAKDNGNVYRGKLHPQAAFDVSKISGKVPLAVSFTNRSWEGNERYHWDFGDGGTSTEVDPVHTYLIPGIYTVTLTVDGPTGAVSEKKVHLVRAQSSTSIAERNMNHPERPELMQNYPNPFNPSTEIGYRVQGTGFVTLKVFDVLGREVETLVNDVKAPGSYTVTWDASRIASGVYFYSLSAGSFVQVRKLILLK